MVEACDSKGYTLTAEAVGPASTSFAKFVSASRELGFNGTTRRQFMTELY